VQCRLENTIAWVRLVLDRNILCPHEASKLPPGGGPVNRIDSIRAAMPAVPGQARDRVSQAPAAGRTSLPV